MLLFQAKGAKSWNGMWRPTSVWLSLIGSMVTHGCTWFAPSKSPQVQRVTKVESPLGAACHVLLLNRKALFASIFLGVFYELFFCWEILNFRWSYSQNSDQISLKYQVKSCRFLVVGISWIYWSKVFQVTEKRLKYGNMASPWFVKKWNFSCKYMMNLKKTIGF